MTRSYVWVTVALVLLLEVLLALTLAIVVSSFVAPYVYMLTARQAAEQYAYAAALQANGATLAPNATFQANQPGSLASPGKPSGAYDYHIPVITVRDPVTRPVAFALLLAPDGQTVASSYPQRYPIDTPLTTALPQRASLSADIHTGASASGVGADATGGDVYALAIVWSRGGQPIGAVYVQLPGLPPLQYLLGFGGRLIWGLLVSALLLLIITAPIGAVFGALTTRGVVRRISALAAATTRFADGEEAARAPVGRHDEIGRLALRFNAMAERLVASGAQRQALAGQNARLEERARISRELHDAISQDLFSLRLLCGALRTAVTTGVALQPYVETLDEATTRMIREMRVLLLELRPSQLDARGLPEALAELAATYSARVGLRVVAEIAPIALAPQAEHALFRIAQEALTNAARHADATTVTLRLRATPGAVTFTIADDGKGFVAGKRGEHSEAVALAGSDTASETSDITGTPASYGLGLRLMRERIEELHGEFVLTSAPGEGTRIMIRLPAMGEDEATTQETREPLIATTTPMAPMAPSATTTQGATDDQRGDR